MQAHPINEINFNQQGSPMYVIEASAGTGKTWTTIRLIVKALLQRRDIGLENILIVTFTKAAASELKERVLAQLHSTLQQLMKLQAIEGYIAYDEFINEWFSLNPTLLNNAILAITNYIQNFDIAKICTIHGFCHSILKEYALECGVNANITPINNYKAQFKGLVRLFIQEKLILNPLFSDNLPLLYQNLNKLLKPSSNTVAEKTAVANNVQIDALIDILVAKLPDDLIKISHNNRSLRYQIPSGSDLSLLLLVNDDNTLLVYANLLGAIANYIVANFAQINILSSNTLTHDDVVALVADCVMHNPTLAADIYKRYPLAFIDEFQDTDALQWQVFKALYLGNHNHNSKCKANDHTTRLVVVGDPKQAIYKFRGADLNVYLQARDENQHTLYLNGNRRSHKNIVNFINRLFMSSINKQCFGKGVSYYQVDALANEEQLLQLPSSTQLSAQMPGVKFYDDEVQIITISNSFNSQDMTTNLLRAMAVEIAALVSADYGLIEKIAVLVTTNNEATMVIGHLQDYGVKAAQAKLGSIFATQVARDLYKILRAIADLSRRAFLQQAIATRLFNISLRAFLNNANNSSFNSDNTESTNNSSSSETDINNDSSKNSSNSNENDDSEVLIFLEQRFFYYRQIFTTQGIISMIYAIIEDIYLLHHQDEFVISRRNLSNLLQLGEIVNDCNIKDIFELLYWYNNKIIAAETGSIYNNATEDMLNEDLVRLDDDAKQVTVVTQHTAKGLEYDILFCPFFKASDNTALLDAKALGLPFFTNTLQANKQVARLVSDIQDARLNMQDIQTEINRLNYVALTRAKSRLYIYLRQNRVKKDNSHRKNAKVAKINELFGYDHNNIHGVSNELFDYQKLFQEPHLAMKDNALPGVAIYQRSESELMSAMPMSAIFKANALQANSLASGIAKENLFETGVANNDLEIKDVAINLFARSLVRFSRNSYTSLAPHANNNNTHNDANSYQFVVNSENSTPSYRYSILNELSGASFGVLIHSLCEQYPLTDKKILHLIRQYLAFYVSDNKVGDSSDAEDKANHGNSNISSKSNSNSNNNTNNNEKHLKNYSEQLQAMVGDIFAYPLLAEDCYLANLLSQKCLLTELQFNFIVRSDINFSNELRALLIDYYGYNHPYVAAASSLGTAKSGFLQGFIDVVFSYQGKYYVLDYKTNLLPAYDGIDASNRHHSDTSIHNNPLVIANANNHYYLQYLIYLVALKRHLEICLDSENASHLLGGVVYYYVRGVFIINHNNSATNASLDNTHTSQNEQNSQDNQNNQVLKSDCKQINNKMPLGIYFNEDAVEIAAKLDRLLLNNAGVA